jgi:hypothetical protein
MGPKPNRNPNPNDNLGRPIRSVMMMSRTRPPRRRCGGASRAALRGKWSWSGRDRDSDRDRDRGRVRVRDRDWDRVRDGGTDLRFGDGHPRAGLTLALDTCVEGGPVIPGFHFVERDNEIHVDAGHPQQRGHAIVALLA